MLQQNSSHTFNLYDLRVELVEIRGSLNSYKSKIGDYFTVVGENIYFPANQGFSMYNLAAIIPLLAAKQRHTDKHDWMSTDCLVTSPDPDCGAIFKITRIGLTTFKHEDTSVNKIN